MTIIININNNVHVELHRLVVNTLAAVGAYDSVVTPLNQPGRYMGHSIVLDDSPAEPLNVDTERLYVNGPSASTYGEAADNIQMHVFQTDAIARNLTYNILIWIFN